MQKTMLYLCSGHFTATMTISTDSGAGSLKRQLADVLKHACNKQQHKCRPLWAICSREQDKPSRTLSSDLTTCSLASLQLSMRMLGRRS